MAYYLSRGSTKAEMLVQFLNEVLGACQNVGLRVVATVCDMGTNSVKTMKLLGSTTSVAFFQFQNQAIATIYDIPHLLKCTRNLFLRYDVQFESERLNSQLPVAKWEHIEKLYKHDRDFAICMFFYAD
jgi:UDP:flavonoid glycosyltransferase YjiC (YdhE family)